MRIALVSTVKNEANRIVQRLAYDQHLGVTDFFIFLEGSSDGSRGRIQDLPGLTIFEGLTYQDLLSYGQGKPGLGLTAVEPLFYHAPGHSPDPVRQPGAGPVRGGGYRLDAVS